MKKILLLVLLIAGGIFGFKYWDKQQNVSSARLRVAAIVQAMAENDRQKAIGLWAENRASLDMAGLEAYQLRFQSFWSESGLSAGSGWTIESAEPMGGGDTVTVTLETGGQKVRVWVRPDSPIAVAPGQ